MDASIVLCVMMLGGLVYPESEITIIPLKDDLSSANSIQDLEWKERVKCKPLPRVPALDDRQQSEDDRPARGRYRGLGSLTNRRAPYARYLSCQCHRRRPCLPMAAVSSRKDLDRPHIMAKESIRYIFRGITFMRITRFRDETRGRICVSSAGAPGIHGDADAQCLYQQCQPINCSHKSRVWFDDELLLQSAGGRYFQAI